MGRTIVKQIRVTRDEATRARTLLAYLPECATEAELLRLLLLRGLLLTEVELIAGGATFATHPPLEQLTAIILPRILPVMQLLVQQGVLLLPSASSFSQHPVQPGRTSLQETLVDPAAARDLLALGTSEL